MADRSGVISEWWPATQSLDLVEGPVEQELLQRLEIPATVTVRPRENVLRGAPG